MAPAVVDAVPRRLPPLQTAARQQQASTGALAHHLPLSGARGIVLWDHAMLSLKKPSQVVLPLSSSRPSPLSRRSA